MFDSRYDEAADWQPLAPLQARRKRERICLRPARSEDYVLRLGSDGGRDNGPRLLDQPPRLPAFGVDRGRIAAALKGMRHRRLRFRAQRRGGVPVEIDALGHGSSYSAFAESGYGWPARNFRYCAAWPLARSRTTGSVRFSPNSGRNQGTRRTIS